MAKGFFISKTVGLAGIVLCTGAVATIIGLSVVYSQEKSKNVEVKPTTVPTTSTATTEAPVTTPALNEPWHQYRLPDSILPDSYEVTLWPRLTKNAEGLFIFTGDSSVIFRCLNETDLILIHSNKLNYTLSAGKMATLTAEDGSTPPSITETWLEVRTQYLVVRLNGNLKVGQRYVLHTVFTGELADDLGGFYRSVYMEDGVEKVVATTQMQPTDARKAFPCFDEPAMKAVFNITLIHPQGTRALSNSMDIESTNTTIDGEDVTRTKFAPTPKMSTYLLAFIVSDFGFVHAEEGDVLIRIFARRKAIDAKQGEYALNKTGPILKFFETYYNVSYPLSKSDQIALPDFNAGAMENWGLITYRETALLYDPLVSSNGNKERIAAIIAHELAHMWFGNLVTLKWWNDLWLNEGFASYVEYLGADHAEPDWGVKDMIVLSDVHRVFAVDALASSHPLSSKEEDIQRPEQISELFDAISYSKGASVLRMLSDFLSEHVFVMGLNTYLNQFAYSNTIYSDLWDHLEAAVKKTGTSERLPATVHEIMNRWVLQMGFPVVSIDTATGTVSQEHFLLDPDSVVERPSEFNYTWYVPITWQMTSVKGDDFWLLKKTDLNDDLKTTSADQWVLANLNVSGYYRVKYDHTNYARLLNQLTMDHELIPVINRAQLIDDAFNLARAKLVTTELALDMTEYLHKEREYMPWESALDNLDYFYLMFDRTEVYGLLQTYIMKQVTPLFDHYANITDNWVKVPDGHTDQYNQVNALSKACSTGMKNCTDLVTEWYGSWMNNPQNNPIHPNLRSTVYCSAIAAGGAKEWDHGWKMFDESTIAIEKDKLRAALACASQPWLLNRYLEYTLDSTLIRKQDATSTIVYIANNVVGQPLAWDFMRANWEYIFNEYGGGSFSFSNLINGVTKRFSTKFELEQLQQFKQDYAHVGFGSGTVALEQSIERTQGNIKWVEENRQIVQTWLKQFSP
ncbi:aminopeptidase Ey-like [Sardina pilchardus]|uniref:aminopeptidase Ey-like n=1 Tax=Sardina pilchardus TaxID=27697 RepID=UPI002E10B79C